jgi:hypothetical protein
MKIIFVTVIAALITLVSKGQGHDTLHVTMNNYTYLVFDSKVIATESGTDAYFHEADKNIVSLQSNNTTAKPTTLMVQTETNFYVWIIQYKQSPKRFLYNFKNSFNPATQPDVSTQNVSPSASSNNEPKEIQPQQPILTNQTNSISTITVNPEVKKRKPETVPTPQLVINRINTNNRETNIKSDLVQNKVNWLLSNSKISYRDLADIEANIFFSLYEIYLDDKYIYFKLNVTNTSSIAYDIDFLSFEIRHDKGLRSRESTSAILIQPVFQESVKTVFPDTNETFVYGMQLYAFEEKDKLNIKITELGGRRSLDFHVPAKTFTNAKKLPL